MRGGAAYDRDRRRLLRDDPRPRQADLGLQRVRPRRRARFARGACGAGPAHDRAGLDPCRHGAGRGRCLGCDPCDPRPLFPRPGAGAGDPLRRKRISGRRTHRLGLGASRRQASRRCRRRAPFPVRRTPSGARRRRQVAGAGAVAQGDRGGGPSRLLRGPARPGYGGDGGRTGILPPRGGFRLPSRRGGRAHHRELPRPRRAANCHPTPRA